MSGLSEEKRNRSPMVRVRPEVEELVRYLADKYGYDSASIRNMAILFGLPPLKVFLEAKKKVRAKDYYVILEYAEGVIYGKEKT